MKNKASTSVINVKINDDNEIELMEVCTIFMISYQPWGQYIYTTYISHRRWTKWAKVIWRSKKNWMKMEG